MTERKQRMTVTLDHALVRAGAAAVAEGRAASLSAWVSSALTERAAKDRRLAAMDAAIAAHEVAHGEITVAELAEQRRVDRQAARVIAPGRRPTPSARRRKRVA